MKLPDFKNWKLPRLRRVDLERLLIVGASALVVVLALGGGGETTETMIWEEPPVSAETSSTLTEDVPMTSTVCWYEDGDGYLVPVTRQIPLQDGVAKATLALMVESSENDLAAARIGADQRHSRGCELRHRHLRRQGPRGHEPRGPRLRLR